jgi:plasmid stabilization system protein ParE
MASIIWTKEALQDIGSIADFISKDSEFYAKQFVKN